MCREDSVLWGQLGTTCPWESHATSRAFHLFDYSSEKLHTVHDLKTGTVTGFICQKLKKNWVNSISIAEMQRVVNSSCLIISSKRNNILLATAITFQQSLYCIRVNPKMILGIGNFTSAFGMNEALKTHVLWRTLLTALGLTCSLPWKTEREDWFHDL